MMMRFLSGASKGSDITLSALGGDLNLRSGAALSATGAARLTSNRNIFVASSVTGNQGVAVTTTWGAISFTGTAADRIQSSDANINVSASGAINNVTQFAASGTIDISGSSVTTGTLGADGNIAVTASSGALIGGGRTIFITCFKTGCRFHQGCSC